MRGRKIFREPLDPYLAPPETDPWEPPDDIRFPQCPSCGLVVELHDGMDEEHPQVFGRYWPPRWSVRDERGDVLFDCPECGEWLVGREVAEGAGLPGDWPWRLREHSSLTECWLAQFSDVPCDGRLVKAHLIPKQRIKREVGWHTNWLPKAKLAQIVWDERVWVPACGGPTGIGGHHGMLDGRTLSVPRSALPVGLEAFALEYGLVWSLDRDFGLREAAA